MTMPTRPEPYEYELSKSSIEGLVNAVAALETADGRQVSLRPENVLQFWVWSQMTVPEPPAGE